MKEFAKHRNAIVAALVAGLLGVAIGTSVGESNGFTKGRAEGFAEGSSDGWYRGIKAATAEIWWDGVVMGCNAVFNESGWDYLVYKNAWGMITQDVFCKDNGDHSSTPTFDVPYVAAPGN